MQNPETYELRLRGRLDPRWSSWFDGMTLLAGADGITVVTGPVTDQAALQGLLRKVHDMGIELIAVTQLGPAAPQSPETQGKAAQ